MAVDAYRTPELRKARSGCLRSAANETIVQHDGVDGASRCAGNPVDLQPAVLEQLIEHAPGERAMGTAALEREIDALSPADARADRRPPWRRGRSAPPGQQVRKIDEQKREHPGLSISAESARYVGFLCCIAIQNAALQQSHVDDP